MPSANSDLVTGSQQAPVSSVYLLSKIEQARESVNSPTPTTPVFRPPRRCLRSPQSAQPRRSPPVAFRSGRPKSVEAAKCIKLQGSPYQGSTAGRSFDVSGILHQFKIKRPPCTFGVNTGALEALSEVGLERADRKARQRRLASRHNRHMQAVFAHSERGTGHDAVRVGWSIPSSLPMFGLSKKLWRRLIPDWASRTKRSKAGCNHYTKGCNVRAACCGGVFSCKKCHDMRTGHTMSHAASVICTKCGTEGPVGASCNSSQCRGRRFAKYFCSVCEVWEDRTGISLYHCKQCNKCLPGVGFGVDSWHCDRCNKCFDLRDWDDHQCKVPPAIVCGGCLALDNWSPHDCKTDHMHTNDWSTSSEGLCTIHQQPDRPAIQKAAILVLQKLVRGWLHRKRFKLWKECADSATTIQAILRTRRSSVMWSKLKQMKAAAVVIQSAQRASVARQRWHFLRDNRDIREEVQRELNAREAKAAKRGFAQLASLQHAAREHKGSLFEAAVKNQQEAAQVDRGLAARVRGKKLWARVKLARANGEIRMQAKAEAFDILKVEFMGVTRNIKVKPRGLKDLKKTIRKKNEVGLCAAVLN